MAPMSSGTHLAARGEAFRRLHDVGIFVMPCAWDAITARLFDQAGFAAIGTTSGGVNWSHGRPDYVYSASFDEMLESYGAIADATRLPVSGDLENGYSDDPEGVADVIGRSIAAGMVGGSIEDRSLTDPSGLVPVNLAAEKVAAAREAADASGITYTLTARAESLFTDVDDRLDDAILRVNRYVEAGADCIFIPGVADISSIETVVRNVDAPVSVGIGSGGGSLSLEALTEAGVRRVSTGGALPRSVYAFIRAAAEEMLAGSFAGTVEAIPEDEINNMLTVPPDQRLGSAT